MVAHGFPPAGGSGSNRALAFARYLPAFGWRPIVLTLEPRWASNRDDQLLGRLPPGLTIVRTHSLEGRAPGGASPSVAESAKTPGRLRRQLGHLKRFPDAHVGWLPYAIAAARKLDFDVVYSSSGPFTSHLVGLALHRLTAKPLVAELRDGWYRWNRAIFPDYPAWRDAVERRLEASVISAASRVVLVTERMAHAFRCQYADLATDHFTVVSNGFDHAQFPPTAPVEAPTAVEILHAGALYYGRSLANFLDAAARVVESDPQIMKGFRLTLLGTLDAGARAEISRHPLGDHISFLGYRDHRSTIEAMQRAEALLLVANTTHGAEATVPGKLFEYLAVGRPVLAVAPPDSASAEILDKTRAGWLAPAHDVAAIADALRSALCAVRSGPQAHRPDAAAVARYDRRVLTGKLAHVFDDVLAARRV